MYGKDKLYDILLDCISINFIRKYPIAPIKFCAYISDSKSEILTVPIGCGSSVSITVSDEKSHIFIDKSMVDRYFDVDCLMDVSLSDCIDFLRGSNE